MKHPDDTAEAAEVMRGRAQFLINNGMGADQALDEAITYWQLSLRRAQAIMRYNNDLRSRGKPTLHVSLFEAAKLR
jgi:hypothetical protein